MPLKKPSDFFKNTDQTSLDTIKGEMDVAHPDRIEKVSEAFNAFRTNLNHIQSLTDFTDTFSGFKDNVDKVDKITEELLKVKEDIQGLIRKEDLDDAMMAHLYFVEESIAKIEKKATKINRDTISNITEEVSDLSGLVNKFLKVDAPKYKKLVTESETRVDQRFLNFKDDLDSRVENLNQTVSLNISQISESIEGINQEQLESVKDEIQFVDSRVDDILRKDLPEYKKFFAETEIRTDKKIKVFDEKISQVNEAYSERLDELNSTVKEFVDKEIPRYSNLLLESKIKSESDIKDLEKDVLQRIESLTARIKSLSKDVDQKSNSIDTLVDQKVNDLQKVIIDSKQEISSISKTYDSLYKDFKKREISESKKLEDFENSISIFSDKMQKLETSFTEDICELQENLDTGTSKYFDTLKEEVGVFEESLSNKLKDLKVDFTVNEKHIDDLKDEFKVVIEQLQLSKIEEKNKQLTKKIEHIEEVFEKFNEKTVLTEQPYIDNPTIPGKPSNKTTDPLTQLDKKFVTLDQLQQHYRLFINRIQTQLATIGGGGAGFIKDLDDVTFDESSGTNELLIYNGNKWVGIASTALSGGSTDSTLDDVLKNGNVTGVGMSVGVITATNGFFSGILTAAQLNYDVVTDIFSTGIVTATKGIQITSNGINVTGVTTLSNHISSLYGGTTTITVIVADKVNGEHRYFGQGSGLGYVLDGVQAPFLTLNPGRTYRFDVSDSSNGSHPFRFYLDAGKVTQYTTGVTVGSGYVDLEVTDTTPQVLHYQCSAHGYMGNAVQTNSNIASTAKTLETARTIGGVSFNGSANINLPGVNEAGNQNTSGNADTATLATNAQGLTGTPNVTVGTVVSGNINSSGIVTSSGGFQVGTAATIAANGNATFSGIVTATSFTGDGTGLTGVASTDNIQTATPATFLSNVNITGVTTASGGFKGNLVGDVTGDVTGNADTATSATTATTATNITVSANNNADETVFPIFVDGATGGQGAESDTGFTYNPNSGTLTATIFSGALSGSATGLSGNPSVVLTNATVNGNLSVAGTITSLDQSDTSVTGILTATALNIGPLAGIAATISSTGNVNTIGIITAASLDISGNVDVDGTLEADAITVDGTALNTVIAGVTVTNATNAAGITGTPNITVGDVVAASLDISGDADIDGTLEADAITVNGTALDTHIAGVTVTNATNATNVTAADESSDTTCFPLFATSDTGNVAPKTGSNLTFNSSNGTLTATSFSGSGAGLTDLPGASEEDTSVSSTSATTVFSFAKASFRTAFVKVLITQGSAYQSGMYGIIHDGTTATIVEQFAMATGSMLGTFTVTISGSNVLMQVNMGSSSSATVTTQADKITV